MESPSSKLHANQTSRLNADRCSCADDERLDELLDKLEDSAPDVDLNSLDQSKPDAQAVPGKPTMPTGGRRRSSLGSTTGSLSCWNEREESPEEELARVQAGIRDLEIRLLQAAQQSILQSEA